MNKLLIPILLFITFNLQSQANVGVMGGVDLES